MKKNYNHVTKSIYLWTPCLAKWFAALLLVFWMCVKITGESLRQALEMSLKSSCNPYNLLELLSLIQGIVLYELDSIIQSLKNM